MTRIRIRAWREFIVLLAALACAGSWASGQVRSVRDRSEVAKMTEKRKTVCVGRYLIDVPAQAEVSLSGAMLDGFEIETKEESESAFQARLEAQEAEILAQGRAADGAGGMVEARDLRIPGMIGRIFVYGRHPSYWIEGGRRVDDEWVSIEIHAHTGGHSFTLIDKLADEARTAAGVALLARLRPRGEEEIPDVQGFCISHGVFAEPLPPHQNEHMVMHVGLPAHPDMALTLASIAGARPGPGLLARVSHTDATMGADLLLRMTKLREGKRSINGIDGEEVLTRAREFNFTTTYGLNWESRGVDKDLRKPYLSLELQTGINDRTGGMPVETSLHEDALLALWDSISSSIRLQTSDSPPPSALPPEPSGLKLGALASAGDMCPQTGWWRCDAGGPDLQVHGGQVQYLRKGDRMPQALLLPRQTMWQKVRGIQPSIEADQPTVWILVDKRQRSRITASVPLAQPGVPTGGAVDRGRAVALGTYARTGDPCLASGWWRCDDPHALDGTRWFARGSVLPVATFQVPTGVFTRPGGPDFIQRRSGWQLVRHAEVPAVAQATASLADGLPVAEPPAMA